jgi:tRNA threonylcarbamoyladenosine biosynthesis protein TsaE
MNKTDTFITNSFEETKNLGEKFAKDLKGGEIIALYGDLGGGKTTFVQGLALGLGIKRRIISPTFIIVRTYDLKLPQEEDKQKTFYHIDLYRTGGPEDFNGLGLGDIIADPGNIVAVEWAEKMKDILPGKRTDIFFKYLGDNRREITIRKNF